VQLGIIDKEHKRQKRLIRKLEEQKAALNPLERKQLIKYKDKARLASEDKTKQNSSSGGSTSSFKTDESLAQEILEDGDKDFFKQKRRPSNSKGNPKTGKNSFFFKKGGLLAINFKVKLQAQAEKNKV